MHTPINTLRRDLIALWSVIAAVSSILVWLLFELSRQGATAQIEQARFHAATSCQVMQHGALQAKLLPAPTERVNAEGWQAIIDLALREEAGSEGGFWQAGKGVFAYAFPTYDGTGVKRDPPSAELEKITNMAELASHRHQLIVEVRPGLREAIVFAACPLDKMQDAPVAWVMKRILLIQADVLNHLSLALALLIGLVVMSGAWLAWMLGRWQRQVTTLVQQLAQSERMATLGRVSAGLAHEIRNPLATMRMKVENAMAASPERYQQRSQSAFEAVLSQTSRLERLISSLLALTHPLQLDKQVLDLRAWLSGIASLHQEAMVAQQAAWILTVDDEVVEHARTQALLDPEKMAQVMDNLILNALAHVPAGGSIELGLGYTPAQQLRLWVADSGSGVPEHLRSHVFEPFSTARSGGTGLGLALAREIVQAHGGELWLADTPAGACFEIELPWHTS
jgi:two-component system, NtrC family, sensor histidine kinase HydH